MNEIGGRIGGIRLSRRPEMIRGVCSESGKFAIAVRSPGRRTWPLVRFAGGSWGPRSTFDSRARDLCLRRSGAECDHGSLRDNARSYGPRPIGGRPADRRVADGR